MNLFNSIDYTSIQSVFNDAISSLLNCSGCAVTCTLEYGVTKYESCANCVYDPIGRKSSNRYLNGGPLPFPFGGLCPLCNGAGQRPVVSTEDVDLIVVYDPRDFMQFNVTVDAPNGLIQTMSKIELMPKLQTAKSIKVSKDIEGYFNRTYERVQEPMPCGFGKSAFAVCTWKRI